MPSIAIFGYNHLSFEVLKRLQFAQHEIIIAEQDLGKVANAIEHGYSALSIDFRSDEDLRSIGIGGKVKQLFCFLPEDSDNVFLTLSARALDSQLKIIVAVEDPDCIDKLIAAGANKVIDPYQICGRKFYDLIKKPEITSLLDDTVFGRGDLHVAEVTIAPQCQLLHRRVSDLKLNLDYNLILLGIVEKEFGDDFHFIMGEQQHKLDVGDVLVVLGPSNAIQTFKHEINHA